MPRLTTWRAKRSAFLRERRQLEVQEAAKWRKEATRHCRNCSMPYRDQTPVGGKFICTFCGHISRRPLLDVPLSTLNVASVSESVGSKTGAAMSAQSSLGGGYRFDTRIYQTVDSSGGPWGYRGWPKFSMFGVSLAWTASRGRCCGPVSSMQASYGFPLCSQWDVEHANCKLTGWFGKENFGEDVSLFLLVFRVFFVILVCLRWLCQKAWSGDTVQEESSVEGGGVGQLKEDDASNRKGSRGEKARRKAEEKRQARISKEQMEADERRQREEVARLVEERRRLRDEKVQAGRVGEREIAAEGIKELPQVGDAEHRRQEKLKERETSKDKPDMRDVVEDGVCPLKKDRKKRDIRVKNLQERKLSEIGKKLDAMKAPLTARETIKQSVKSDMADSCTRGTDRKMAGYLKARRCNGILQFPAVSNPKMPNSISTCMLDSSPIAAASSVSGSGSICNVGVKDIETLCTNIVTSSVQHLDTDCSAWNNVHWSNVWSKVASTTSFEVCAASPAFASSFDLQLPACSGCLDKGDWSGGVHVQGNFQTELKNFADLDQEGDLIIQSRVDPAEALTSQHLRGTNYVAPIGPQQVMHVPLSGVLKNCEAHTGKHASPLILEPWKDDFYSRRQPDLDREVLGSDAAVEDGNWKMWEAPQLDQIQIPCMKDSSTPLAWMIPRGLSSDMSPSRVGISAELETQLSNCYSSSQLDHSHLKCPTSLPTISTSLWSDQPSVFSSTNLQRSSGVVDHSTQGMIGEPATMANDYFSEHSSVLRELQTYDTSLIPGEYLAPFSEKMIVTDRSLKSDQGKVHVEQRRYQWRGCRSTIHRDTVELPERRNRWSVGIVSAAWSNSGATISKSLNTYGGFYSTPSAHSVWSFNAP